MPAPRLAAEVFAAAHFLDDDLVALGRVAALVEIEARAAGVGRETDDAMTGVGVDPVARQFGVGGGGIQSKREQRAGMGRQGFHGRGGVEWGNHVKLAGRRGDWQQVTRPAGTPESQEN